MKRNGLMVMQARIEKELSDIGKVVKRVEAKFAEVAQTTPDDFIVGGFAGYLNNFYNGLKKIFKLVVEYIDGPELPNTDWHKELLKRMTLEVPSARPPILTSEVASVLQDYLDFRYLFWHTNIVYLDWNELKPKVEQLKPTFERLEAAFQQFVAFLQAASEHIE